jgi:hypothetical protein
LLASKASVELRLFLNKIDIIRFVRMCFFQLSLKLLETNLSQNTNLQLKSYSYVIVIRNWFQFIGFLIIKSTELNLSYNSQCFIPKEHYITDNGSCIRKKERIKFILICSFVFAINSFFHKFI